MLSRSKLLFAAALMTAAIAAPAFAQKAPQGAGMGPVAVACKDDIAKHCAGKEHAAGEVRKCLEAKKATVSAACKTALDTTGPVPGKGMGGMGGMSGQQGMGGMGGMSGQQGMGGMGGMSGQQGMGGMSGNKK